MRTSPLILLLLGLAACQQPAHSPASPPPQEAAPWTAAHPLYEITDLNPEDFSITSSGDTVFYTEHLHESLGGKTIRFNPAQVQEVTASFRTGLRLLQYTTDDHGTTPLAFFRDMGSHPLPVEKQVPDRHPEGERGHKGRLEEGRNHKGRLEEGRNHKGRPILYTVAVPDPHGNGPFPMERALGFSSRAAISQWLERTAFAEIRAQSLEQQRDAYISLLQDRERYASCCPEYLAQAQEFLAKDPATFTTLAALGVETVFSGLVIDLHLTLHDGSRKHLVLVSDDALELGC